MLLFVTQPIALTLMWVLFWKRIRLRFRVALAVKQSLTFRFLLMSEQIPGWAIELIKQVERLNEKLPTHVDWVERNIKDHEARLRQLEQFKWVLIGISLASGGLAAGLMKVFGV